MLTNHRLPFRHEVSLLFYRLFSGKVNTLGRAGVKGGGKGEAGADWTCAGRGVGTSQCGIVGAEGSVGCGDRRSVGGDETEVR